MKKNALFSSVEFVKSASKSEEKPKPFLPEFAFVGRSNVGKSSVLNALFGRKGLAKISSKPGKTRLLNFFLVSKKFYCVDLPGYGYARLSQEEQKKWQLMIEGYLLENPQLQCVYVLVDARHEPMAIDLHMLEWLSDCGVPFKLLLSKADKAKTNHLKSLSKAWQITIPDLQVFEVSIHKPQLVEDLQKDVVKQYQSL